MKLRSAAWWTGTVLVVTYVATNAIQQLFDIEMRALFAVQLFSLLIGGLTLLYLGLTTAQPGERAPKLRLNEPTAEDDTRPPR